MARRRFAGALGTSRRSRHNRRMLCRGCGTEIADKAIVCYRCGQGTTDPVRRPVPIPARRSPMLPLAAAAVLILIAVYLGYAAQTAPDPERLYTIAGVLAGAAILLVIVRLLRRH